MGSHRLGLKRKQFSKTQVKIGHLPHNCGSFFLDSGAHSLFNKYVLGKSDEAKYKFYQTKEFFKYLDEYVDFVKACGDGLDYYVTVDVIYNPEMSWEVLKLLESKGIKPVPVIHGMSDLKWLEKHLKAGYDFIGIGGLGQDQTREAYIKWADRVFNRICAGPDRLPCVKTHGFAVTTYALMLRYPFYSVDSASWAKAAGFGMIYVPHKRNGKFVFDEDPYTIGISHRSELKKKKGKHYHNLSAAEKKIVREWLEVINMPLGNVDKNGDTKDYGVVSEYNARAAANCWFFEKLCEWLPKYPWPFKITPTKGFGFF